MRNSTDRLRDKLGNYWEMLSEDESDDSNTYLEAKYLPIQLHHDLRGFSVYRIKCDNDFIDYLEINPARIEPINKDAFKPNFKIPCRLYANEDNSRGDKFWQIYFNGGSWGGESYPKVINNETVFYDCAFNTFGFYSKYAEKLYSNSMSSGEKDRVYTVQSNYFDYNGFLQKYQNWATEAPSEQALINSYAVRDYVNYASLGASDFSAVDINTNINDSDQMAAQKQTLYDYYFYTGSIYRSASMARNEYYGAHFAAQYKTPDQYAVVKKYQENIIFDNFYFQYYGTAPSTVLETDARELRVFDPDIINESCSNRLTDMYNISLTFPKPASHWVLSDPDTTTHLTPTLGDTWSNSSLRSMMESTKFTSKFIELMKDIDDGTITEDEVYFGNRKYETQSRMYEGAVSKTSEQKFRTLKFLDLLAYAYNNPAGALNENYCFMGPSRPEHLTTYRDNKLYRFTDNQNLINTLDATLDVMRKRFTDLLDLDYDPSYGSGDEIQRTLMDVFFNTGERPSEVLMYKVEKIAEGTSEPTQKFWLWNSFDAPDMLSLLDSQVKYDKNYTYKVYAYVASMAFKYKYGDLKLTKQIGTIHDRAPKDGFADATVEYIDLESARPDLYCMQFYDAETLELASQLFGESSVGERRDGSATAEESRYTAIAEYNTFATAEQDISEYPQLADFNLYVEPCWEIMEIPMFAKTLKVLDSPPNSNSVIPFQFIDNSYRIGFNIFAESFKQRPYPITISDEDKTRHLDYMHSRNLFEYEDITEFSESPARYIEIYKTKTKPTSFESFQGKLASTIDLRIENDPEFNFSSWVAADKITPNTTYYYVFRILNENKIPGPLSQIITAELIDDGGYIFSLFDTLDSSEFLPDEYTKNSVVVKKIFQLEPHLKQLALDSSNADFSKTATSQAESVTIGTAEDKIWDKKFKIRLTSRKTGKKIDLNVTYNLQDIDYTMHTAEY